MAVEPCGHFDAAYSGGSALGQSFAFVDRSSSGKSAPIAAILGLSMRVELSAISFRPDRRLTWGRTGRDSGPLWGMNILASGDWGSCDGSSSSRRVCRHENAQPILCWTCCPMTTRSSLTSFSWQRSHQWSYRNRRSLFQAVSLEQAKSPRAVAQRSASGNAGFLGWSR